MDTYYRCVQVHHIPFNWSFPNTAMFWLTLGDQVFFLYKIPRVIFVRSFLSSLSFFRSMLLSNSQCVLKRYGCWTRISYGVHMVRSFKIHISKGRKTIQVGVLFNFHFVWKLVFCLSNNCLVQPIVGAKIITKCVIIFLIFSIKLWVAKLFYSLFKLHWSNSMHYITLCRQIEVFIA